MKARRGGFTLVEIAVALTLLAGCGLAMLGLLAGSLNQARSIHESTAALVLGRNLRTLLRNPAWPPEAKATAQGGAWTETAYFDATGALMEGEQGAMVRAELTGKAAPAFVSTWLEQVEVRLVNQASGQEMSRLTLLREVTGVTP
jgi:uncharacterized protein (TIGR02598 family)